MSELRQIASLGFNAPGEPFFAHYDEHPPHHGQVRLRTLYSGFSAGTELTFMKGTNPYFHARWDDGERRFYDGEPGMHYPVPFVGYMEVGEVIEGAAPGLGEGTRIAGAWGHKSGHMLDPRADRFVAMPDALDPILGIYAGQMGPIAANALLHADRELIGPHSASLGASLAGRPVLVFGGGVVGFLIALFAQAAGASEVVLADPSPFRRLRAETLGLTAMEEPAAIDHAKSRWKGADLVFQTRADARSLDNALRALRPHGAVIDLAFYQGGADAVKLGEAFHHNWLSIRCAQIGAVPRGMESLWDHARLSRETLALLTQRGADIRQQLITHEVPIGEAPDFLRHLVAERPEFIQIVFRYDP